MSERAAVPAPALPLLPALPLRAGQMPMKELIDLYMAHYAGRDCTRLQRLRWWVGRVGSVALQDLSDDHVHAALEELASQHSKFYAGTDAEGRPILRAKKKPMAPATVNRYAASLAAVVTWAIKRRIAPKGYVHPCRSIERRAENNEKTRFLSDEERGRLLQACRESTWPRLYVLVLMALTTGARKSELTGLRWRDVDLQRGEATVAVTKNGDPRVLPLVPAVVEALLPLAAGPSVRLFPSRLGNDKPFTFEPRFKDALKAARVRGFRFHDLRHSCASILAKNGATLLEIGDLLGHRQVQMSRRYAHLATGHKAALVNRVMHEVI
jgi:integrase